MTKTRKVAKTKVTQGLSKDMKNVVGEMISKALKASDKRFDAIEKKLAGLKMGAGSTKAVKTVKAKKAKTKKAVPAMNAVSKAKPKKAKKTKKVKKEMMSQA